MFSLALAPAALADGGGLKPSQAPSVVVGQHYFGSTEHPSNDGNYEWDFWRLPALVRGDVVTMAWSSSNSACLATNVDDYSWAAEECNASDLASTSRSGSARSLLTSKTSGDPAFLEFHTCCNGYPYDFTIESIQHRIGLSLQRLVRMPQNSFVRGTAVLGNGQPVPNGLVFALVATWPGHRQVFTAGSNGGQLRFNVRLPASARKKRISLSLFRPESDDYLQASSLASSVQVS